MRGDEASALGAFVRDRREELGLSQAALARRMSMSAHALGRLERGERGRPRPVELRHWASVLEVDVATLTALCLTEYPIPPGGGDGRDAGPVLHAELPPAFVDLVAGARVSVAIWQSWLPGDMRFQQALGAAVANGAALRIIVLDPTCPAAVARARALGFTDPLPYLRANLDKLTGELGSIGADPLSVLRLAQRLPPGPMYATESRVLVGWFFPGGASTVRAQVEVGTDARLAQQFLDAFDREWGDLPGPAPG